MRRDLERRVGRTQSRREIAGHTWSRAEKKQLETTARAHRREGLDQVHTRDGLVQRAALTPRRPHHADPIRQAQAGRVEHARKLTILLCAHDELCVDSGHKLGYAILDEALDALQSGAHVEAVDPDSEDSGFCQASCR